MLQAGSLRERRVLITGGGTGLGFAMAERFAQLGAALVLIGRRKEVLMQARRALSAQYRVDVQAISCDVREAEAVEEMFDEVTQRGPIDALVNNAAATFIAQTERLSSRAADAILAPTMHGGLYCTLQAGRRWIDAGRPGVVLSILSTSTRTGRAFTVPSAMAKSALLAMTRSLAVEWGPHGIRTVAIAPGMFPTEGSSRSLDPGASREGLGMLSGNPLGRVGKPQELAELAAFLISDCGGYINGEMIAIDGGQHLRHSGVEDIIAWTSDDWERVRQARHR